MHRCCTQLFYRLFYYMEHHDLLNPVNNLHLFALHYVYVPRINRALDQFKLSWNNHGIRTERGKTPNQLFTEGALRLRNSGQVAIDFFDSASELYGVDFEDDSIPPDDDPEEAAAVIVVPTIQVDISEEQIEELKATIDPLSDSDDCGLDIYQRTLDFLNKLDSDQQ